MTPFKTKGKQYSFLTFFLIAFFSITHLFAYDTVIRQGDSNTRAKNELIRVFDEGGSITFEEGNWTINLNNNEARITESVTIIGQNVMGTGNVQGAYETPASNIKSIVNFTGERFSIQKGCALITMRNITLNGRGFIAVNNHQVEVDLENTVIDITSAARSFLDKQLFRSPDGIQGNVVHCTFKGFERGFVSNRSVGKTNPPQTVREKITIDWSRFLPEPFYETRLPEAFIIDAGNDEYPVLWDQSNTTIKNSYLQNCRIACSKGENLIIDGNTFFTDVFPKEPVHIEEFSQHITVKDNQFIFRGTIDNRQVITLGATQSSNDIIIQGNTVDQLPGADLIDTFAIGMALNNITLTGNTILNPLPNQDYINFWGCGASNITIAPNQQGLGPSNVDIRSNTCNTPLEGDGTYIIKWNTNEYLGNIAGNVRIVSKTIAPTSDTNFLWEILDRKEDATTLGSYFTIRNLENQRYLQVYKGANAPQQRVQIGQRFSNGGLGATDATFQFDFTGISRPSGWSIYEGSNNRYMMSPGMNEHKTELVKLNSTEVATLFVIENRQSGTFNWTFEKVSNNTLSIDTEISSIDEKLINVYPNPTRDKKIIIDITNSISDNSSLEVFDVKGNSVYINTILNPKTNLDLATLANGVYFFQFEINGNQIVKRVVIR